jgi:hypothetical protein
MRIIGLMSFTFFLTLSGIISGQVTTDSTDKDQIVVSDSYQINDQIDVPSPALAKNRKIKPGLEVGTSFTYSPGNFFGPSFYVAPNFSYLVTPRFMVQAGFGVERSNFQSLYENNGVGNDVLPMTRAFFYARGSYLLTSNLTVNGTVFKSINDVPKLSKYSSPVRYSQNGAIIGLNYKLNSSLSIGFHIQVSNNSYQSQYADPFNPYIGF